MFKLTLEEFNKLSREEKRQAVLNFTAPTYIYQPQKFDNRIYREDKI